MTRKPSRGVKQRNRYRFLAFFPVTGIEASHYESIPGIFPGKRYRSAAVRTASWRLFQQQVSEPATWADKVPWLMARKSISGYNAFWLPAQIPIAGITWLYRDAFGGIDPPFGAR